MVTGVNLATRRNMLPRVTIFKHSTHTEVPNKRRNLKRKRLILVLPAVRLSALTPVTYSLETGARALLLSLPAEVLPAAVVHHHLHDAW